MLLFHNYLTNTLQCGEEPQKKKIISRIGNNNNYIHEHDTIMLHKVVANEELLHIADILPPTFNSTCPSSPLVVYAERGLFSAEVNWTEPAATDNSGILLTISSNHKPFERFNQGTHVITYTTADQSGNKAICTFTIDVRGKNNTNIIRLTHTHVCI